MQTTHYIELVLYKTYADLRAETEKTYMGFLWWIIDPLFFMLVFYVVFGLLLGNNTDNFIPFLLIGLVTWRWFDNTIIHGSGALQDNGGLMRQVYIPKLVFPVVTILTDLVKFSFVFSILLIYLWFSGFSISLSYLALPFIMLLELTLIVTLTLLTAALVPFFPDLKILITHVLHIMFFLSGIFFSSERIPEAYQAYFYLNPMARIIESYREVLIHGHWPHWQSLTIMLILAVLAAIGAGRLLMRYDRIYPKIAGA